MRLPLVPVTLLTLLLLAGCHSSDSGKPTATDTASSSASSTPTTPSTPGPHGPSCKDVWQAGATLPKDYTTCDEGGTVGTQDVTKCKDGTKLVAYSDTYYAITGGRISKPKVAPMQDTLAFGKVYASCTGE